MEGRVEEFLIDRASRAREGRRLIASKELPRTRKGRHKATEGGLSGALIVTWLSLSSRLVFSLKKNRSN